MKKSALHKDFFIEIKKTYNRFLSILLIVALGVAFFAGLRVCRSDMELSADTYYDDMNLMDFRVVSTLGLTEDDIEAISKVDGVEAVEAAHTKDVLLRLNNNEIVVKTYSLNENVNKSYLVDGRLPTSPNECIVDTMFLENTGYKIGDKITMESGDETDLSDTFKELTLTIVGSCQDPRYLTFSRGNGSIGNGNINSFIILPKNNFSSDIYEEAYVTFHGSKDFMTYSEDYDNFIKEQKIKIEEISTGQLNHRYQELVLEPLQEIEDGKKELADAKASFEKEKKEALQTFDEANDKLDAFEETIKNLRDTLDTKKQELYAIGYSENDVNRLLATQEAQISTQEEELLKQRAELKNQIATAEKEFNKAEEEITSNEAELKDAEVELSKLEDPEWYILDRNTIESYVSYGGDAKRMEAIAQVFPAIFFLVAALVCLTTMTRMVDEQRVQIGTLKALGYSKSSIASKYILYALLATVTGSIIGVLIGQKVFPSIVLTAYKILYNNLPYSIYPYRLLNAIAAGGIAVVTTTLATYFACYKELRSNPAKLMRPVAPKVGKRILLERITFIWKRLNFTQKSTLRNLFRYKKRLLMTVIGIAGCMALLIVGFGIKDSIGVMAEVQYGQLWKQDAVVTFNSDMSLEDKQALKQKLLNYEAVENVALAFENTVELSNDEMSKSASIIVLETMEDYNTFFIYRDRVSKEAYSISEDGLIITEKLAKELDVTKGDKISIQVDDFKKIDVNITAVTENYIQNYIYMTPKLYEDVFGKKIDYNQYLMKHQYSDTAKEEGLFSQILKENKDVLSISSIRALQQRIDDMLQSLNIVVYVLIICAGMLAFIVLYNLSNININERKRELASLKVLGFYDKEVNSYVMRETILLTLIGILFGTILGIVLHRFVIVTCEVEGMMFGRLIKTTSFLISGLLTLMFSFMISFVMYFKLKKINMIESLKSVE